MWIILWRHSSSVMSRGERPWIAFSSSSYSNRCANRRQKAWKTECAWVLFFSFFFFSSNKDTRQLKSTALGNKKNQINCVPSLFFYFILKVNFIIIQTWTDYTSCIIFSKIRDECLSIEQRISPFTQSWFFERETSSAATPLQNNKTNSNSFRFFFSRTR